MTNCLTTQGSLAGLEFAIFLPQSLKSIGIVEVGRKVKVFSKIGVGEDDSPVLFAWYCMS